MSMVIVRNADIELLVQLTKNSVAADLSAADAAVTFFLMAMHLDDDGSNTYASHEQSRSEPGADWDSGLVLVRMPREKTSRLPLGGKVLGKLRVQTGSTGEERRVYWPQFTLRVEPEPL